MVYHCDCFVEVALCTPLFAEGLSAWAMNKTRTQRSQEIQIRHQKREENMIEIQPVYAELTDDLEMKLDEADHEAALSTTRLTHQDVFGKYQKRKIGCRKRNVQPIL